VAPDHHSKGAAEWAAYSWLAKRDRGFTVDERGEFERWLNSDRRNAEAVAEITGLLAGIPKLSGLASATGGTPDPDLLAPKGGASRPWPTCPLRWSPSW
jgi:ferric-dicitrate binding protein FerR (iron transport regulator)